MLKSSQVAPAPVKPPFRRWWIAAAAASLFYPALASALGLGEITLHSALEQPFNADIELVDTAGLSADEVHVSIASPEAYASAGIDRLFFFNDLRFTTVIDGNLGVVHVISKKPVSEPYLNFLVRLARPNGDLLHAYTLLIDPPDSPQGRAAARARWIEPKTHILTDAQMPVAPPQAVQGNHYTVVRGDNLASIARRLQGPGNKASSTDIARGIQALNTQAFPNGSGTKLKTGESLLLPDIAVLPRSATPPVAADVPSAAQAATVTPVAPAVSGEEQRTADLLAANAIENQQLTKSVGDLKGQLQTLQDQVSGKDKQVVDLQTALAELKTSANKASAAAIAPVAVVPVAAAAEDDSFNSMTLLLIAVLVLLLLLGLAYSVRRNRKKNILPVQPVYKTPEPKSPVAPLVTVVESPSVVTTAAAPASVPASPSGQRLAGTATDALDGASIYIAYGRFAEALGILRDASVKQPERNDLRVRILELLAEQGDIDGFAREEQVLLDHGISAETVQAVRQRYAKSLVKPEPAVTPGPETSAGSGVILESGLTPQPAESRFVEPEAPVPVAQPVDEFHLNLDDLSMDADWDLVDPFDAPPAPRSKNKPGQPSEIEPEFASNLTQLPEVFEMPDEQYLSDFAEPEVEVEVEPGPIIQSNSDLLDDEFLDSFMNDSTEFDLLDLTDEEPLTKINQAQVLIDEGELEEARALLNEVIEEGDLEHQRTAQDLLARIS